MAGGLDLVIQYVSRLTGTHAARQTGDRALIERFIQHRDEAAIAELVHRHGPMVWTVCRQILPESHDAEDAFQATFLVLVRKARSIKRRDSLKSWLHGVAYRIAIRAKSAGTRRRSLERQGVPMDTLRAASEVDWQHVGPVLHDELVRLPEKYRLPLLLCCMGSKTHEQAADELSWPVGTVKTRLLRAKEMLLARLDRRGLTLSAAGLTAVLSADSASALPLALVNTTIQTALLLAAGKATVAGAISAPVAALTEGAIHAMFMTKMKAAAVVVLAIALVGSGGVLAYRGIVGAVPPDRGERPIEQGPPHTPIAKPGPAGKEKVRRDSETTRAAVDTLTANLDKFQMSVVVYPDGRFGGGGDESQKYDLTSLSLSPSHGIDDFGAVGPRAGKGYNARISKQQAAKIIDLLAARQFFDRATKWENMGEGELKAPRGADTPYLQLFVSHFVPTRRAHLDFPDLDADAFRFLDAVRKELDGEARTAMDKLLGPLEQQVKAEWGKEVTGVQCRLTLDKPAWKQGEVPSFKAEVRNKGKRELLIWRTQELCEIVLDGKTLRWSGDIDAKSSAFGPGRHYKDMAVSLVAQWKDKNGKPPSLPPGKHTVRVWFRAEPPERAGGGDQVREEDKPLRIESNEVVIEIATKGSPEAKNDLQKLQGAWGPAIEGIRCRLIPDQVVWKAGEIPTLKGRVDNQCKHDLADVGLEQFCEIEFDTKVFTWSGGIDTGIPTLPAGRRSGDIPISLGGNWKDKQSKQMDLSAGNHKLRVIFLPRLLGTDKRPRVLTNEVEIEIRPRG
jgi:RNA polymerase sigma factor (sigma-70 family)